MKAFVINRYGQEEKLQLVEVPDLVVGEHEVLIQVHAAGVNPLDSKIKNGEFRLLLPYQFPLILGHDVAGIITKVGTRVKKFQVGDAVFARPSDFKIGTFAEFISVNEGDVALKPSNITMEEAASFPLVALTVWQAFIEKATLKKGQKVFIQAGSGGVGSVGIQLAKYFGTTVATTTSRRNFSWVQGLGADIVIDYKTQDFETLLSEYDLVLNSQDEKTLEKSLRVLRKGGHLISISGPPSPQFAKERGLPWWMKIVFFFMSRKIRSLANQREVNYSFLFMRANGEQLSEIGRLIEKGVVRPVVDEVFPFEKLNEALEHVSSGRSQGKVVVKFR